MCPPGRNTPLPLERSPPGSFKRLLGSSITRCKWLRRWTCDAERQQGRYPPREAGMRTHQLGAPDPKAPIGVRLASELLHIDMRMQPTASSKYEQSINGPFRLTIRANSVARVLTGARVGSSQVGHKACRSDEPTPFKVSAPVVPEFMTHDKAHGRLAATHGQSQHVRVHDHELSPKQLGSECIENAAGFQHVYGGRRGEPEALAVGGDQLMKKWKLSLRHENAVAADPSDSECVSQKCSEGQEHAVEEDHASRRG